MKDWINKLTDDWTKLTKEKTKFIEEKQDELKDDITKKLTEVTGKIDRMDETDVVMTYVKDEIQAQIDTKIAQMISEAKEDMQVYI